MTKNANAAKLTSAQIAGLKQALLAKRSELTARLDQATAVLGEGEGREPEHMDRAEAASELDERAQQGSRQSQLLDEIEAALARLDAGSYGLSEESGEPIGYDRLKAVPWARRTAREEEAFERRR